MNKLKILSDYLKSAGLKEQAYGVIKLGQTEEPTAFDPTRPRLSDLHKALKKRLNREKESPDPSDMIPPSEEDLFLYPSDMIPPSEEDLFPPAEESENIWDETEDWMKGIPENLLTTASDKPIGKIRDLSSLCKNGPKPVGVWYAQGSEWLRFISIEMPVVMEEVNYVYSVKPNYSSGDLKTSSGGVLRLDTEEKVLQFSNMYSKRLTGYSFEVSWPIVCSRWDGIEIIPYQQSLSLKSSTSWYGTWDIPSGCIWRQGGALEIDLLRSRPGL